MLSRESKPATLSTDVAGWARGSRLVDIGLSALTALRGGDFVRDRHG
jgi:hypothetical protein